MIKYALFARLEAKPGKEAEVQQFLEAGRQAHLSGPIAKALMAKAPDLFAKPPSIEPIEVLGLKNVAPAS